MIKKQKPYKLTPYARKFNGVSGLFKSSKKKSLPLNQSKHRKLIKFAKGVRNFFMVLTTGVVLLVTANTIKTAILNARLPAQGNNFEPGEVFDGNGNDIEFDENGSIIEDDTTEKELALMNEKIMKKMLNDCGNVEKIDEIVSVNLLPYNLFEEDNEYDKYMLSFLLKSDGENYLLSYLTGSTFESKAIATKDYLGDFLNYLTNQCAFYGCLKNGEMELGENEEAFAARNEIAALTQADFVGNWFLGYDEYSNKEDDAYYNIPLFINGQAKIYKVKCKTLDGQELEPMQTLYEQLAGNIEPVFEEIDCENLRSTLDPTSISPVYLSQIQEI